VRAKTNSRTKRLVHFGTHVFRDGFLNPAFLAVRSTSSPSEVGGNSQFHLFASFNPIQGRPRIGAREIPEELAFQQLQDAASADRASDSTGT
jgi:hypothetical protein